MTEIMSAPQAASGAGVSRRRIMQGAAWAAPAIVIATAAPAAASSTSLDVMLAVQSGRDNAVAGYINAPRSSLPLYVTVTWPANSVITGVSAAGWTAYGTPPANTAYLMYGSATSGGGTVDVALNLQFTHSAGTGAAPATVTVAVAGSGVETWDDTFVVKRAR